MGNQGMTNWKLTALFAIGLMLIAGLFSNAAIAANGDGTVIVEWEDATGSDFVASFRTEVEVDGVSNPVETVPVPGAPLAAGSSGNKLRFSYRATTDMAGGQVRIAIGDGTWKVVREAGSGENAVLIEEMAGDATGSAVIYDIDGGVPSRTNWPQM